MTTIPTNDLQLLPSWDTSYLQYFKQSLGMAPAPSTLLLEELNGQDSLSYPTLLKVVTYLADYSHAKLEQLLKEKLAQITPLQTLSIVQSVSLLSLREDRLKMLDVCKRIVSLDQLISGLEIDDAIAIAERESSLIPKPTRIIETISDTAIQNWHKYSSILGKIVHWFQAAIMGTFTAVGDSILFPLNHPPSSIMEMQGHFNVYRSLVKGFTYLTTTYLAFFAKTETAGLAGIVILTSAIAINHIHKRFRLGIPATIDRKEFFKNISIEAQNGQIKQMKGRHAEKEQVQTAWHVARDEKFRIALLVGPTGCGKTEFVKGLAWESVNDPASFVYRKKIFMINTIQLVKEGTYHLTKILAGITEEGLADDVVLFFDEGHNAGSQAGLVGSLIETLKTTLIDNNIRAILATTKKEYNDNIAHNEAFVDRCAKITFEELPDPESKEILKDKVELDVDREIEVEEDAYDTLLTVAKANHNRYNPRKVIDLHKDVRSFAINWQPKNLSRQLAELTADRDNRVTLCRTNNNNPDWSNSPDGIKSFNELETTKVEIPKLAKKLKTQKSDLDRIAHLRGLGPRYRKQYNAVVHQVIADQKPAAQKELQKEFLYLKHILRPALQDTLESEARRFTATYQEELPLKIDAALIKKLYPDAFIPKNSLTAPNSPKSVDPLEITTSSTETSLL